MEKSAGKSASVPGKPFRRGHDPRRGKGPRKGAANAGRPPSQVREACLAAFDERIKVLMAIADNKKSAARDRISAIEKLAKYGFGDRAEEDRELEPQFYLDDVMKRKRAADGPPPDRRLPGQDRVASADPAPSVKRED